VVGGCANCTAQFRRGRQSHGEPRGCSGSCSMRSATMVGLAPAGPGGHQPPPRMKLPSCGMIRLRPWRRCIEARKVGVRRAPHLPLVEIKKTMDVGSSRRGTPRPRKSLRRHAIGGGSRVQASADSPSGCWGRCRSRWQKTCTAHPDLLSDIPFRLCRLPEGRATCGTVRSPDLHAARMRDIS